MLSSRVDVIKARRPDIIVSMFNPPASIAAKILGIPLVSFTQSCMHPRGKRVSWWENPTEDYEKASTFVNRVLADWNVDPIAKMEELNKGSLTVIASFPEFDPVADDDVAYIGPSAWNINNETQSIFHTSPAVKMHR